MTNSTSPAAPTHAVATNASNSVDAHHPAASPSDANVAARSIYEHYVRRQKQLLQQFKQDLADATGVSRPSDMAPNFRDEHEQAARDNFSIANDQYDAGTRGRMSTSVLYVTDDDDGADESSGSSSDGDLPPPTTLSIMPSTNGTASVANKMSAEMSRNVNGAASPPPSRRSVELVAQVVLHALQQNETGADMDMHAGRSVSHKSRRGRVGGFQYAGKRMPVGKPDSDKKVNGTKTTPRVRGSKAEYKRLDELYNKSIHDYYLAETTQSLHGTDDVWEEYTFVVRRTFGTLSAIHVASATRTSPAYNCATNN
jgi:hypothetical protein